MNWDAIGAIGQAVSALALVFVLIQLRYARDEVQRSVGRARLEGTRDMELVLATHPELASVFSRVAQQGGTQPTPFTHHVMSLGLTKGEAAQVWAYYTATWHNLELAFESTGRMSPGVKEGFDRRIRQPYSLGNSKWYELTKSQLNPEAVRYIDNLLGQPA